MSALEEQVQMEIGMVTPFVELPFEKFGMCTNKTWLKMMWKNLGSLDIELLWYELTSLKLHREVYIYIMSE